MVASFLLGRSASNLPTREPMQLQLSEVYPAPNGDIEIVVGINTKGRWARFNYIDRRELPDADAAAVRRIILAYKAIGYHAKRTDIPGTPENAPILGITTSLTQSYQAPAVHTGRNLQVLATICDDIETFRDVIGAGVSMYRRLAPFGKTFADLTEVYNSADAEVKNAIRKGLGGLVKVAALALLSAKVALIFVA